jgi:hypothetical protein
MSINTFSCFIYGHTITSANNAIDFDEGGSELQATIDNGDYTLTEFAVAIKTAMDAVGALTYTVSVNRATRAITIASSSNFTLRCLTGSRAATTAYTLMGFDIASNKTGTLTYTGTLASGSIYCPQSKLFDYISSDDWNEKNDAVSNESASGVVQVVYFGDTEYMQCNIRFATNKTVRTEQSVIQNQTNGKNNLRTFMQYAITKAKLEFVPDLSDMNTYEKMILDKTEESSAGTSFKLKELENGPGYFETGKLIWRVVA